MNRFQSAIAHLTRKIVNIMLVTSALFASATYADEIEQINKQLWQPFIAGWKTMDASRLVSLHTEDAVRVMERHGVLQQGQEYLEDLKKMVGMMKNKGVTSELEFRFSSRLQSKSQAWQKGIYRAVMNHPERGKMTAYAEFSVLLEKHDGRWLIKFDHDLPSDQMAFDALIDKPSISANG